MGGMLPWLRPSNKIIILKAIYYFYNLFQQIGTSCSYRCAGTILWKTIDS